MINLEAEVTDIKRHVIEISEKLDELLYEKEITAMMKLSEKSLFRFIEEEPDIYKITDLKVRYHLVLESQD
ncbi:MAG: hypothetical protein Q8M95_11730 [Candidatus Methanoperedens sp.]|nr:hypothetical protein [Candidatus Methanoperedens sp.]